MTYGPWKSSCGRYVSPSAAEAERYFTVHLVQWEFARSFNVAPTQQVPVIRLVDAERQGLMMRRGAMLAAAPERCAVDAV